MARHVPDAKYSGLRSSRITFSGRLREVMKQQGITINEVALRVRAHLPDGETFATSNLAHYRTGRSLPRPRVLKALSLALGVSASDLLPEDATAESRKGSAQEKQYIADVGGGGDRPRTSADPVERIPPRQETQASYGRLELDDFGSEVRVKFDQRVSWEAAITILQVLKAEAVNE